MIRGAGGLADGDEDLVNLPAGLSRIGSCGNLERSSLLGGLGDGDRDSLSQTFELVASLVSFHFAVKDH